MVKREIFCERLLNKSEFGELGFLDSLKNHKLLGMVTKLKPSVKDIVLEFYANLVTGANDHKSPMFHKVFVRGHLFDFSPAIINDYYGSHRPVVECEATYDQIISELTASVCSNWPGSKSFPAVELSLKYSVLHKIALKNWMPSTHSTGVNKPLAKLLYMIGLSCYFDIGQLIYDQIVGNAEVLFTYQVLPFPSLIYGVLMSQIDIKKSKEVLVTLPGELRILKKLLSGKHVDVVQGESLSVSEDELPQDASCSQSAAAIKKLVPFNTCRRNYKSLLLMRRKFYRSSKILFSKKGRLRHFLRISSLLQWLIELVLLLSFFYCFLCLVSYFGSLFDKKGESCNCFCFYCLYVSRTTCYV